MTIEQISPTLSVSPQIDPQNMGDIAARGFRTIICNRPDGEEGNQPAFSEIEAAAKSAGLEARYIPVTPGMMTAEDVEAFGAALDDLPQPVLAYCKTGRRSSALWAAQNR